MKSSDIANIAKVSRSTVSRVLNGSPKVSRRTRERVEAVIREYNYVPDASARCLVGKRSNIIGLFIIDIENIHDEYTILRSPFYSTYLAYAIDIANRIGYNLLISVIRQNNIENIRNLFNSNTICGGIVMGDYIGKDLINQIAEDGNKILLYHEVEKSTNHNIVAVNYDNFKCGKIAGDELIKRGHKKIAHITGEENKQCPEARLDGLIASMKLAGLTFDRNKYLERGSFHRTSGGYEATKRLLKNNKDDLPTAICVGSSVMMKGALEAITDFGLNVPDDISLIGIDGIDFSKYSTPSLTEIAINYKKIASTTISKLVELVENNCLSQYDYEISDTELIIRDSIKTINY